MTQIIYNNEIYSVNFAYRLGHRKGRQVFATKKKLVDVEGKVFFTFVPTKLNVSSKNGGVVGPAIRTKCVISVKGRDGTYSPIASAESVRNPTDVFKKVDGRAFAFSRAIVQIPDRNLRKALAQNLIKDQGEKFLLALGKYTQDHHWNSNQKKV